MGIDLRSGSFLTIASRRFATRQFYSSNRLLKNQGIDVDMLDAMRIVV
jgi:hypothetical protein